MDKNSLDLLRLVAAAMVLCSHQFAMVWWSAPQFFGLNAWGGVGVSIFFFLSGHLVWTSWTRDPDRARFFLRRSLRIFPAPWVACLLSVVHVGKCFELVFGQMLALLAIVLAWIPRHAVERQALRLKPKAKGA